MSSTNKPMGRFKKSWLMLKGSVKALSMDKEIVSIPLISMFISLALIAVAVVIGILGRHVFFDVQPAVQTEVGLSAGGFNVRPLGVVVYLAFLTLLSGIGMIFTGSIIHAAIERFNGNDPTVRSSIKAALKRGGSLIGFGAFSYIIGYILSQIAERIPIIGGKIIAWLAGSAWSVASFFSIPVIVTSDVPLSPIQATKKSIGLIKKVWGESIVISFGIALFAMLGFIVYSFVFGLLMALMSVVSHGAAWPQFAVGVVGVLGFFGLILVYATLDAFARAAVYHYATTGEAPAHFDERMMRAAFTPKKARKLFGSA